MRIIYLIIIAVVLIYSAVVLYRMIKGPSIYDRMNGMSVIGANVILLILAFGFIEKRPDMFIDIAIAYAIMGFITNIVVSKYLGGKDRHVQNIDSPSKIDPPEDTRETARAAKEGE